MLADTVLPAVVLCSVTFYALGAGADFGGGMWDLLASGARAGRQREAIAKAIGPIWEANHVWLILVLVVLFTGYPVSFGIIMTALHIPMTAILVGIVLRGSAFVFRSYDQPDRAVHRRWSTLFGQASLMTPFLLGLCLGALASGEIRVENGNIVSGFLAGWTDGFAISCGLFAQALFAFLAATYLTVDTRGQPDLQEDFRTRAAWSCLALLPMAAIVFFAARRGAPYIFRGLLSWWAPVLLIATSLCAVGAVTTLWLRKFDWARAAAVGQVALILVGWGLAQYPYIVVPDVTFLKAAAPEMTLRLLTLALALGAIVLFPSFAYLFYIFKKEDGSHQV
ncbi:MAG: cytochrome d ubiquinol oxidase subunit II [Verrucomicrobiales bacterium]|nr:cytochrome d ubiquinol oxidase subunit II [Verrucomicrobiales bacterium]